MFINKLHRKKINVLLTGSNSRLLSSELATHLTGRQVSIELFPFSFAEYLIKQKIDSLPGKQLKNLTSDVRVIYENQFNHYMNRGGFPEIISEAIDSKYSKLYLKELYDKIISRDLVQRRKIKNIKALREISLHMMSLYSSQFTYQSVKAISTVHSVNTVKNYIEYIQEAYMGFVLEPFSHKIKERISLPKKYYVIDTALVENIIGRTSLDHGKRLENIIFIELKRRGLEIYYYKRPTYEIDFVILEAKNITELIQVCWSLNNSKTREREIKALSKASQELKCTQLTLITFDEETSITIGEGAAEVTIRVIPAWKWLLSK